jgi:acyl-CoA dehydrogenase
MELLLRFGNPQQQQKYLLPLLKGETRSCFAMTEPNTASSNPTQIQTTITGKSAVAF